MVYFGLQQLGGGELMFFVFWFKFCDGFFGKLCSSTLVRGTFEADQLLLGSTFVRELQLLVVGLKDLLM